MTNEELIQQTTGYVMSMMATDATSREDVEKVIRNAIELALIRGAAEEIVRYVKEKNEVPASPVPKA